MGLYQSSDVNNALPFKEQLYPKLNEHNKSSPPWTSLKRRRMHCIMPEGVEDDGFTWIQVNLFLAQFLSVSSTV